MKKKNNNKYDVDINVVRDYLMSEDDNVKLRSFLRLYSNYFKINKFSYDELQEFENEIYTIDGRVLTEKEKIKKECSLIEAAMKNVNDESIKDYVKRALKDIKAIEDYDDNVFEGYIPYLKKSICILQALLKLDINFYNTSYELFYNEYSSVKKNIKKDNNIYIGR